MIDLSLDALHLDRFAGEPRTEPGQLRALLVEPPVAVAPDPLCLVVPVAVELVVVGVARRVVSMADPADDVIFALVILREKGILSVYS